MQRWGEIKEMREASSEFDSVIALTSETVTRGVSLLPQRRLPRAAPSPISQSVTSLICSCTCIQDPTGLHSLRYTTFTCKSVSFCLNQRC